MQEEKIIIEDKLKNFNKLEKKYIGKLNRQQDQMKLIMKLLDQQAKKNVQLHQTNKRIQNKLLFHLNKNSVTQEEFEDFKNEGLIDDDIAQKVEEWLELKYHRKLDEVISPLKF